MEKKNDFELILDKARELTEFGLKKADDIVRVSKLKLECVKINNEINVKYAALGKMTYQTIISDDAEFDKNAIAGAVLEIRRLKKRLLRLKSEIEKVRKIVTCPVCGTKNSFSSACCSNCMHTIITTDEAPSDYEDIMPDFGE